MDGLRAVAVLPVILFHAGFDAFRGGYVGVDVFFVISGYLITGIILEGLERGTFSLAEFYERRARRILPALFLVMATCLPFAWVWFTPRDMRDFLESVGAVALFGSNILFWQESGYFDAATELKPLLHTWSLAVEEQYYLLFPVAMLIAWRWRRQWLVPVLGLTAVLSLLTAQLFLEVDRDANFYLLPTRAWELLAGALLAVHLARATPDREGRLLHEVGAMLGVLLLAKAVFRFDQSVPFPSLKTLVPVMGTLLLLRFASARTVVGRVLAHPLPVGIGLISYSAYLWHQPLFAFARQWSLEALGPLAMGSLAVATLGLAYLSWRFVERPFRDRARIGRARVFALAGAGSLVFLVVAAAGMATSGFAALRQSDRQGALLATTSSGPFGKECNRTAGRHPYLRPEAACEYHDGGHTVALFGDSHAAALGPGLADVLRDAGVRVKQFSFNACQPMFGRPGTDRRTTDCSEWTEAATSYIVNHPELTTIIVTYRIHGYLFGEHEGRYPALPQRIGAEERERRWRSYRGLVQHLADHGKRVVLVLQVPELPRSIDWLIARAPTGPDTVPGVPRQWWTARTAFVTDRMATLPPGVRIVDPATVFCNAATCVGAIGDQAYYSDDDHLSRAGARLVARAILPHLEVAAAQEPAVRAAQ